MKIQVEIGGNNYGASLPGMHIAIPLHFDGPQPNTYGVPPATSSPFEGSGFVGDTRQGGSCNFETYRFTPHCNGTHTECIGHIANARLSVHELLSDSLIPGILISVEPLAPRDSADSYDPSLNPEDLIIDRAMLEKVLENSLPEFHTAILIRTLPNTPDKQSRDYMARPPAFFSYQAMEYLASLGLRHLLVDLPSVDRLFDEGKLSNHHVFWDVEAGSHEVEPKTVHPRTITEMIYVPDDVPDGIYLLNLQIAAFVSDAAPSRPIIYPLNTL